MLRRFHVCAVSRTVPTLPVSSTLVAGRRFLHLQSPSPVDTQSHLLRGSSAGMMTTGGTSALHLPKRHLSLCSTRYMRVAGSLRPQSSPMNFGGSSDSGGSTAESLTPYVRQHLSRVYGLLAAGCAVAGVGSLLMFATPLGQSMPFWLPMVGGFVPLLWLSFAPPANPSLRLGLYFAFTLLEGMALAPLVAVTLSKGVLGTAVVLTGAVFCGFSAAALLAPRASLLALQGPLFGMLIGMVAISVLNLFYPTAFAHSLILYGGLALFSLFVSVDTQAMIERARCGAGDHVQDALQMFLNVVNIFVRIAQILGSMER
ncbi:Bax inhibitor 1-related [Trypanosoma melophagium]|uniref:Bax inhibitor 1-related n=1 Tax=Trypanosoma melophagium TaxID=715481 RepID=UPI00351AAFC0|nr:Bax inhibitor 1-related [Trypanosoma melophagium]